MPKRQPASALRQLQSLFATGTLTGLSDAQLLERFSAGRAEAASASAGAEAAFSALVDRHGPMVWGVCRRSLGNTHEAEDAFQATFLVLVRRAGSVRVGPSLGRWLHGVARRVSARAGAESVRRRCLPGRPRAGPTDDPAREAALSELRDALGDELARLPPKYRDPIDLCHLQGLTHDEAARRLGWPVGTVRSRLSGGRLRLRSRLARRGLVPTVSGLAAVLAGEAGAAVPQALVRSTARAAALSWAESSAAFPAAVALLEGASKAMFLVKIRLTCVAVLAAGVVASTAGVLAGQGAGPGGAAVSAENHRTPAGRSSRSVARAPTKSERRIELLRRARDEHLAEVRKLRAVVDSMAEQLGERSAAEATDREMASSEFYKRWSSELTDAEILVIAATARLDQLRAPEMFTSHPEVAALQARIDEAAAKHREVKRLVRDLEDPANVRAAERVRVRNSEREELWRKLQPAIMEAETDLASKKAHLEAVKGRLGKVRTEVRVAPPDRQGLEYAERDLQRAEALLEKINSALAAELTSLGPGKAPTVYVPLFRSQSFGRGDRLALVERVIQRIERLTPYKALASPEGADVILDGTLSADAGGDISLSAEWTDRRTKKTVILKTALKPGPADRSDAIEPLSEFVTDGLKLLK